MKAKLRDEKYLMDLREQIDHIAHLKKQSNVEDRTFLNKMALVYEREYQELIKCMRCQNVYPKVRMSYNTTNDRSKTRKLKEESIR